MIKLKYTFTRCTWSALVGFLVCYCPLEGWLWSECSICGSIKILNPFNQEGFWSLTEIQNKYHLCVQWWFSVLPPLKQAWCLPKTHFMWWWRLKLAGEMITGRKVLWQKDLESYRPSENFCHNFFLMLERNIRVIYHIMCPRGFLQQISNLSNRQSFSITETTTALSPTTTLQP